MRDFDTMQAVLMRNVEGYTPPDVDAAERGWTRLRGMDAGVADRCH